MSKLKINITSNLFLLILFIVILKPITTIAIEKNVTEINSSNRTEKSKHLIGTSFFTILNVVPGIPIYFGQIDYGYHLTPKDVLIIEILFWKYYSPMSDLETSSKLYPGSVMAFGPSFAYQHFHWKKLFTTFHLTPLITDYLNKEGEHVDFGFQPWIQFRIGYQFRYPKNGKYIYIEPSIELNYWPISFNVPEIFEKIDDKYPNYLPAPGLNFGFGF